MKKCTLLTTIAVCGSLALFAQAKKAIGVHLPIQKGSMMIGMNVAPSFGFGSDFNGNGISSFYRMSVNPRAGYFVSDHLAVGLLLNSTFVHNSGYQSESYGAGGFVRWYAGNAVRTDGSLRKTRFFIEGGVTFNGGTAFARNTDGTEDKINFSNASPYLMPGFNYFFTKHIALEAGLQLNYTAYTRFGGRNLANEHYAAPFIGLHYFFDKRK